ncbi:hypothetical protein [Morganella morganii]|uniref:hypothetical protein n=1 Tax=Morganella morganii TaxID=582 RepID=UPI00140466E3|nr:hypothetical protein [Morganella morganii]MBS9569149.1 hypothetical protein [Morganella morganii subsp. morganii]QIM76769.1 hypothetical protein F3L16_12230 [Morganella morganii subsp. morganii]
MEPTDFEKWCAKEMGCPVEFVAAGRYQHGYRYAEIDNRYRAYMAGVRSRLPYQTPPKGDEDEMD